MFSFVSIKVTLVDLYINENSVLSAHSYNMSKIYV